MKKSEFWKNKNVLITGICGFVGSNLAKNLSSNGAKVVGLSQKKKRNSHYFFMKIFIKK
tara:strand:+ start:138 stop:314 length:177 start_codon:yes stop_codon:yes gene_type:complete